MCAWKVGTHRTLRLGLFLLVAPSNASPSNDAGCADPISTRHPSPLRPVTTPMTLSWDAGTYLKEDAWYHNLDGIARLTLRELPSTHHLLLFAEWFSVPARLATTGDARGADRCRRPGPNLRLTCCAGTCSPGRTTDAMTVNKEGASTSTTTMATPLIQEFPELSHLSYVGSLACAVSYVTQTAGATSKTSSTTQHTSKASSIPSHA